MDQQAYAKAGELAQKYVSDLLAGAKITVDPASAALLAGKQRQQYGEGLQPFPDLSPEELKRPVATYSGGALTCGDLADGSKYFFRGGVYLASADSISKYAERMVSRILLANRAKSLGLERLPKVKRHIALKSMDKLAGMVYLREVQDKVSVPDTAVAAYYRNNRAEFSRPAQSYVDLIVVRTAAEAARTAADLRKGANFAAVARERSIDETRQSSGYLGPIPRDFPAYPEVAARAFSIPLGTISDPFPAKGGYAVIKVSKRDAARQPGFDEVKDQVKNMLMQRQHDQRFQQLITALKGNYPVTIDGKALAAAGQQKEDE
jgi:parvulin-like peptidyl-prolyl isomerase